MNKAIEIVKQNPWKITLGTIITVCITLGSFYFTDKRYVKRVEYEEQKALIEEHRVKIEELLRIINGPY